MLDSTPLECGRSVETARRSQLAEVAGYGYKLGRPSRAIPNYTA